MQANPRDLSFGRRLLQDFMSLLAWKPSTRPWHIPFLASLCVGFPALLGVHFGRFDSGVLASIGTQVILYMPHTSIPHRMVTLAEASTIALPPHQLVLARMFDIVLGSVIGFVGGGILHHPEILAYFEARKIRKAHASSRGED